MVNKKAQEPADIPLPDLLAALRNEDDPFPPLYLYRLSDMPPEDMEVIAEVWPELPVWRRRALLEDINELSAGNLSLSFEALDRLALHDPDPAVRTLALIDLNDYELSDLIPEYISKMNTDADNGVRAAAADVLGTFVYLGEIEEVSEEDLHKVEDELYLAATTSTDETIRRRAIESLGFSSRPTVVPLIQKAYESTDRNWVVTALLAMGRSSNQDWAGQVLNMLESNYPTIRTMAARAAGELELEDALDPLIEMLNDDNDEARMAAIWSLSQIGGEGVREHLESLAAATDDDDESDFIQSALDNLEFTEDIELFDLLDLEASGAVPAVPKERASVSKRKSWETQDREDQEEDLDDDDFVEDELEDLDELDETEFDDDLETGGTERDDDFEDFEDLEDDFDDDEDSVD
jgi:HEAT repeat protein